MAIGEPTHVSIDRSVEVEDVDVSFAVSTVINWLAMLIKAVVVEIEILCQGNAGASINRIKEQRRLTGELTCDGTDALA